MLVQSIPLIALVINLSQPSSGATPRSTASSTWPTCTTVSTKSTWTSGLGAAASPRAARGRLAVTWSCLASPKTGKFGGKECPRRCSFTRGFSRRHSPGRRRRWQRGRRALSPPRGLTSRRTSPRGQLPPFFNTVCLHLIGSLTHAKKPRPRGSQAWFFNMVWHGFLTRKWSENETRNISAQGFFPIKLVSQKSCSRTTLRAQKKNWQFIITGKKIIPIWILVGKK